MLTGQLPSEIAVYDNACDFSSSIPTVAHILRFQGYRTIVSGKLHFVGSDQNHGFEERLTADIYPTDFSWTPTWGNETLLNDYFLESTDQLRSAGTAEKSIQLDFDREVADRAIERLNELGKSTDAEPFCLLASFTHPHDPFIIPKEYWDRYSDNDIDLPRSRDFPVEIRDPHSARLIELYGFDDCQLTDSEIKNIRRAYFGAISFIDDQVGRLLEALASTDRADNTVVIFLSDHGEMLGERGMWFKSNFFEPAIRVPLIVHNPQHPHSKRVSAPVSLLDFLPTIAEISGFNSLDWLNPSTQGRSLVQEISGGDIDNHLGRPLFGEYLGEGALEPIVMVRVGENKLISGVESAQQLFHLTTDPDERNNLLSQEVGVKKQLAAIIQETWELELLRSDVLRSQALREFTRTALADSSSS